MLTNFNILIFLLRKNSLFDLKRENVSFNAIKMIAPWAWDLKRTCSRFGSGKASFPQHSSSVYRVFEQVNNEWPKLPSSGEENNFSHSFDALCTLSLLCYEAAITINTLIASTLLWRERYYRSHKRRLGIHKPRSQKIGEIAVNDDNHSTSLSLPFSLSLLFSCALHYSHHLLTLNELRIFILPFYSQSTFVHHLFPRISDFLCNPPGRNQFRSDGGSYCWRTEVLWARTLHRNRRRCGWVLKL